MCVRDRAGHWRLSPPSCISPPHLSALNPRPCLPDSHTSQWDTYPVSSGPTHMHAASAPNRRLPQPLPTAQYSVISAITVGILNAGLSVSLGMEVFCVQSTLPGHVVPHALTHIRPPCFHTCPQTAGGEEGVLWGPMLIPGSITNYTY